MLTQQNHLSIFGLRIPGQLVIVVGVSLALLVRFFFLGHESQDYLKYFTFWYAALRDEGLAAFRSAFSTYPPLYLYVLYGITVSFPALPDLLAIKLVSIFFDFLCAFFVYKLVRLKYGDSPLPALAFSAVLLGPTLVLNSAAWAQIDSAYTAALIAALYFLMTERPAWAFGALGLAFAIKFQTAFLFPAVIVLLLKRRVAWYYVAVIPAIYLLTILPALIAGRPFADLLLIYLSQVNFYRRLSANAPNPYVWFPESLYDVIYPAGLAVAAIVIGLFIFSAYKSHVAFTPPVILELSLASTLLVPYVLPKMHERYFFPAEVISIVFAFYFPRYWFIPPALFLISTCTYLHYLFDIKLLPYRVLSLLMLAVMVVVVRHWLTVLYPKDGEAYRASA